MGKVKKILTSFRVVLALVLVFLAVVAIHPNPFAKGVAIRAVKFNSSASIAGIASPKATTPPMSREVIVAINNIPIKTIQDFYKITNSIGANKTVYIKTNRNTYKLYTKQNETNFGLTVYPAPKTNIRKGLDLAGGTRVLLKPEKPLSKEEMEMLIANMKYRLNIYGLSDVIIRQASDLSGNQFVLVEIAGAKEEEVKELLAKQGKFEATIGNKTVFRGGSDITYVCRSADCAGIDPQYGCGKSGDTWVCRFRFAISLSPDAAKRQAELTKNLSVKTDNGEQYLSEKLILYLDNKKVDELNIGAELKGRAVTDIAISGSGIGRTRQEAIFNALQNMKRLQTILITGSLPVKLDIVKTDSISAVFGPVFLRNSLFVGLLALAGIGVIVFVRYRRFVIAIPIILTCLIELVILLGFAALVGWNIDLAAIAGIIIAIGTGVDHQIVITDEILRGEAQTTHDWKRRIKNAFFIIMAAFTTTAVAMIPLWFAGAGLLKGFALTTIAGITIGVLISRPAYARIIEILLKK